MTAISPSSKSALIIAPQWIGDAVMTEPLLRRLHQRGEHLSVAALPWVAPVYRAMPQVAKLITLNFAHGKLQLPQRLQLARQLRGQFDVAYVCPNSFKSALLPFLAAIPERIGYLGETRLGVLTKRLSNPPKGQRPPMVAFYSALSGQSQLHADRPRLQLDSAQIDATLHELGLQRQAYIVLAPGAEYGPAKRWPVAHFAALAQNLQQPVVLLGSAKEARLCAEIEQSCQAHAKPGRHWRIVNLAGKTTLTQALSLVGACRCLVSNDSGLMHVGAGFGVPQVAIFGSSSPLHTPPLNPLAHVLWLKSNQNYQPALECAPCFKRTCPFGHTRCLSDIDAKQVLRLLPKANNSQSNEKTGLRTRSNPTPNI